MSMSEKVVNVTASIMLGSGIAVGATSGIIASSERREAAQLQAEEDAEVQAYLVENPDATSIPVDIVYGKDEEIADAEAGAKAARLVAISSLIAGSAGGLALLINMGGRKPRRRDEELSKEPGDSAASYDDLLQRYAVNRIAEERVRALARVAAIRVDHLVSEEGVPTSVITETTDRVLAEMDHRYGGPPLHANSHEVWASTPLGHANRVTNLGPPQFDVINSTEAPAPSPADAKTIPGFQPVGPEATAGDSEPDFVVGPEPTTSTWQPVAERPVAPAVAEQVPAVGTPPARQQPPQQQPAQWPVAPAYREQPVREQPVAPQAAPRQKSASAPKRRKRGQGV